MVNSRIKQLDIFRVLAALLVLIYHVWVYSGYPPTNYNNIIAYGGEIGVTLFFIISGMGIYLTIDKEINTSIKFQYSNFIKKRAIKIIPAYYIAMFILVFFSPDDSLNSLNGIKDIILHMLFLHNISSATYGSINGVFWTLANIFQFYIIAYFLYKLIKKYHFKTVITGIVVTCIYKILIYNYLDNNSVESIMYFFYGRQPIGTLDNFIIGMFIGYLYNKNIRYEKLKNKLGIKLSILGIVTYLLIIQLNSNILYSNTTFGYIWHSLIAIALGGLIFLTLKIRKLEFKIFDFIIKLSSLEYSIYLWHLPILIKISQLSFLNSLSLNEKFYFILGITLIVTFLWSYIYNKIICENSYEIYREINKLFSPKKFL